MAGLKQVLQGLLSPLTLPSSPLPSLPVPILRQPVCVVGDIHGRADLLQVLLSRIGAAGPAQLIFVGDYIDRGPASAAVLACLMALPGAVCLMGNHERMLLDFLDNPAQAGERWLRNGGAETVASLGILGRLPGPTPAARMEGLAARVRETLPDGAEDWLRALPLWWRDGGLGVVHAGADPARALEDQASTSLLWGHRHFGKPRADGLWIAHGHVIVPEPRASEGLISVDTGAWTSGRLTAAWIEAGTVRFIEAT